MSGTTSLPFTIITLTTTTITSTTTTTTSLTSLTLVTTTNAGLTVQSGQTIVVPFGVTEYRPVVQSGGELVLSTGASASVVTLAPTGTLVLDAGSAASSAGFTNAMLELASGTGGSAGTLNASNLGLASSTGTLKVDRGSNWTINGNLGSTAATSVIAGTVIANTAASLTLSNAGTLAISGTAILAAVVAQTAGATTIGGLLTVGANADVNVLGAVGGSEVIRFGGSGSTLELATPSSFSGTLSQFVLGDTLVLDGFTGTQALVTDNQLVVPGTINGTGYFEVFELAGTPASEQFTVTARDGRTTVTDNVACFCAGTRILTDRGEKPVEVLALGDTVVTASGHQRVIKWIGRRSYAGRFLAANPGVQPVCFHAKSLGNGLPRRDLLVSRDHAMLLDGLLIPAGHLMNGATIVQERGLERVDYYHVELDSHDVLVAEGSAAESFMDDDSRGLFQNAHEFEALYPEAPKPEGFYARRLEQGAELEAIRQRLAAVANEITRAA